MVTNLAKNDFISTLFGKTRQAILSLLYSHDGEAFYLRQIVRATGIGLGPVQRELKQLTDAGIICRTVQGRQTYYQANPDLPIFGELKSLVAWIGQNQPRTIKSNRVMSLVTERFPVSQRQLTAFCRKHHIKKLSLFGSVLRDDFRPDSDIDVLVEFEQGYVPGFGIVAMEDELSRLVGRKVDLRTPNDLSRYFREQVIRDAEVLYAGDGYHPLHRNHWQGGEDYFRGVTSAVSSGTVEPD